MVSVNYSLLLHYEPPGELKQQVCSFGPVVWDNCLRGRQRTQRPHYDQLALGTLTVTMRACVAPRICYESLALFGSGQVHAMRLARHDGQGIVFSGC